MDGVPDDPRVGRDLVGRQGEQRPRSGTSGSACPSGSRSGPSSSRLNDVARVDRDPRVGRLDAALVVLGESREGRGRDRVGRDRDDPRLHGVRIAAGPAVVRVRARRPCAGWSDRPTRVAGPGPCAGVRRQPTPRSRGIGRAAFGGRPFPKRSAEASAPATRRRDDGEQERRRRGRPSPADGGRRSRPCGWGAPASRPWRLIFPMSGAGRSAWARHDRLRGRPDRGHSGRWPRWPRDGIRDHEHARDEPSGVAPDAPAGTIPAGPPGRDRARSACRRRSRGRPEPAIEPRRTREDRRRPREPRGALREDPAQRRLDGGGPARRPGRLGRSRSRARRLADRPGSLPLARPHPGQAADVHERVRARRAQGPRPRARPARRPARRRRRLRPALRQAALPRGRRGRRPQRPAARSSTSSRPRSSAGSGWGSAIRSGTRSTTC